MRRFPVCGRQALIAVGFLLGLSPAQAGPPFLVDDPGIADTGELLLYPAAQWQRLAAGEKFLSAGLAGSYGFSPHTELGAGLVLARAESAAGEANTGFGDVTLGIKQRLFISESSGPNLTAAYTLSLPSGDADQGLGSGSFDHALYLTADQPLGIFTLTANLGVLRASASDARTAMSYGGLLTCAPTPVTLIGIQGFGNSATFGNMSRRFLFGLGVQQDFGSGITLLAAYNVAAYGEPSHQFYLGLQVSTRPFGSPAD